MPGIEDGRREVQRYVPRIDSFAFFFPAPYLRLPGDNLSPLERRRRCFCGSLASFNCGRHESESAVVDDPSVVSAECKLD